MRQNFKTGTTGRSSGDEEREGIRVEFAPGSTSPMVDSMGRLVRAVGSARSHGAPTAPASQRTATTFEREILRERVRAGIAQARSEGRAHGRPPTASLKAEDVQRLKAERVSHSEIARRLDISRTSVRRILTERR